MERLAPDGDQPHIIGRHAVALQGRVLVARFAGKLTLAEAQQFTAHVDMLTQQGPVYALLDMREAEGPEPQAREWIGQWGKHSQILGTAIFGANALLRLVLTLLNNANRLLFGKAPPIAWCASETEARTWIAAQLQRNQDEGPA